MSLKDIFTETDLELDKNTQTKRKPYKRGAVSDVILGAASGVGKGVISVSNAASRFVEGDEVADKRMAQVNEALTPKNQGTAGQVASGITEVLSAGAVGAPLGTFGVAATVGLGSRASEHTKLTQEYGVDQDTADTISNITGLTNGALAAVPMSNYFKARLLDYGVAVGGTTAAGQAATYIQGDILEHKGYAKVGESYKEMSTDPKAIGMSLALGSAFWTIGRLRSDPNVTQQQLQEAEVRADAIIDAEIAAVDKGSSPTTPKTMDDAFQHQNNLNTAIDQVMKGEKVSLSEATGGEFKTMQDLRSYLQANNQNNTTINNTTNSGLKTKTSNIKNLGDSFVSNDTLKGLPIKADEAMAGGKVRGYTAEFAQLSNSSFGSDIKYFSSFNDSFHQGKGSKHNRGQAFDVVLKDPKKAAATVKELERIAKQKGYTIKILDEYTHPSKDSTGGHIHVSVTGRSVGAKTPTQATSNFTGTAKSIYDEVRSNGLSDSDARSIVALAHFETGGSFSPTIKNKASDATGVFQIIPDTWRGEGGTDANRLDLSTQIKLGIKHTKANIKYVQDKTGVTLTESQIYIPHLIGRGGAVTVMRAVKETPNKSAREVLHTIYGDKTDAVMKNNAIKGTSSIEDAMFAFTKRIDEITAKHYKGEAIRAEDDFNASNTPHDLVEPEPIPNRDFSELDSNIYSRMDDPDPFNIILDDFDFYIHNLRHDPDLAIRVHDEEMLSFNREIQDYLSETPQLAKPDIEVPHAANKIKMDQGKHELFEPIKDNNAAWNERYRYEQGKRFTEESRMFTDKEGNIIQELKYKDSYVRRKLNTDNTTASIHVGQAGKSDLVNRKGNKDLEVALDRVFDHRSYGYLSQVSKGQDTISKLEANPDIVINSKSTGEDLTAAQWKQKLQREADNIQTLSKAMKTLAECAFKNVA